MQSLQVQLTFLQEEKIALVGHYSEWNLGKNFENNILILVQQTCFGLLMKKTAYGCRAALLPAD